MKMFEFKNTVIALFLTGGIGMHAQNKFNATYETDSEVVVELQANNTNIIVEPWNRDEMKIEAYLEKNELDQEENLQILESWSLDTQASRSKISIRSVGVTGSSSSFGIPQRHIRPIEMPKRMSSLLEHFSQHSDSLNGFGTLREMQFDFDAYTKDGTAYLKQWEEQVKERLGDNAQVAVHTWSSSSGDSLGQMEMQQHMAVVNQRLKEAQARFEDRYGLMMQQMSERFLEQMHEHRSAFFSGNSRGNPNTDIKRTIKLRIPANARLVLRVRHGKVNLEGELKNLRAAISYTPFTAETLSGKYTILQASYAPVKIDNWQYGELQASYTPSCEIKTVRSLRLNSNSSDLKIGEILDTALISGTFGKIEVAQLGKNFNFVDLSLNNSDLQLRIPKNELDFAYHGSQSEINYPNGLDVDRKESYDAEIINSSHKPSNGSGSVNIRAQYSRVDLQY